MTGPLKLKWIGTALAAVVVVGGGAYWIAHREPPVSYVTRGDVVTTITASGSVNPVATVQVGTYVSGTITSLPCDYNTKPVPTPAGTYGLPRPRPFGILKR